MRKSSALLVLSAVGIALAAGSPAAGAKSLGKSAPIVLSRPNVLLILADDMGYGELSCQGNPQVPMPNIDSLAKNGVRFTSGYVSCPVCSPTRAGR